MKAFSTLLKLKDSDIFEWLAEHQEAFTHIKVSLTTPPILIPPRRGRPLKLYISVTEESCRNLNPSSSRHFLHKTMMLGKNKPLFTLAEISTHQRLITPLSRSFVSPYFLLHPNLNITCSRQSLRSSPHSLHAHSTDHKGSNRQVDDGPL
ncbi:hypothetical protein ACFX2G_000025 [Malus domestica]